MLIITGLKKILKLHVNYSEYYKDKEQDEIQSAYFRHNSFSIFMACYYTRWVDVTLLNQDQDFTVTSEATNHSRIAAFPSINLIIDSLQKFYSQFNNYPVFYIWSDGCASRFWSRFVFALMTHFNPDYIIQWYYNRPQHGKGLWITGGGGTVKSITFQHAKLMAVRFCWAYEQNNGISGLYLAEKEVQAEPQDIKASPKLLRTL